MAREKRRRKQPGMPKLIMTDGKELEIPYITAERIVTAYKSHTMSSEQIDYAKTIHRVVFNDRLICLHDWQDFTEPDHYGRMFKCRKCVKCEKSEYLDLV